MASLLVAKRLDDLLEEVIAYLPRGDAWRAAGIESGGENMGDPAADPYAKKDGSGDVGNRLMAYQIVLEFLPAEFSIPAGTVFQNPDTGLRFENLEPIERDLGKPITDGDELVKLEPAAEFGRVLATKGETFDYTADSLMLTGSHAVKVNHTNSDFDAADDPDIRFVRETAKRPQLGTGAHQCTYAMADTTKWTALPTVTGLAACGQFRDVTLAIAGTFGATVKMRALDPGAEANLQADFELIPVDSSVLIAPEPFSTGSPGWVFGRVDAGQGSDPSVDRTAGWDGGIDPERSVLRLMLRACSGELLRAHKLLALFADEIPGIDPASRTLATDTGDPSVLIYHGLDQTLRDWERSLGIPDGCFPGTGDRETRRRHVLTKFASLGVQTAKDFEALALIFGFNVICQAGFDSPLYVGNGGGLSEADAKQTVVFTFNTPGTLSFPYTFETAGTHEPTTPDSGLLFVEGQVVIMECLFAQLIPSHTQIRFLYNG